MKSNLAFFIGLFGALLISWAGIVLGSNAQLGSLAPYYDDTDQTTYPTWMAGNAARGQLVYKDLGCAACHTQQVRRPGFGSDQDRGWGDRQSVARDYIYQPFPQLGSQRLGPDLANLGDRKPTAPDADDLLHLLYAGSGGMPSYHFLFEKREIGAGAQPSQAALNLTGSLKPEAGWEIVPTPRAEALVSYLVNLKNPYTYPEAAPFAPPKPEGEAAKPAAPAAAPGAAPAPPAAGGNAPSPSPTPAAKPAEGIAPSPSPTPAASSTAGGTPSPSPTPAAAGGSTPSPSPTPAAGGAPSPSPTPAAQGGSPAPSPAAAAASPTPSPTEAKK